MRNCLLVLAACLLAWPQIPPAAASDRYPNLNTEPILPESALETVAELPEPPGNIAVTPEGRIFFTMHPEGRPDGPKLFELKDGRPVVYPDANFQSNFITPLGLAYGDGKLWLIDHGFHGLKTVKLFAFDLSSNRSVLTYEFPRWIGARGSYLNDLRVSPDGRYVYIADICFVRRRPGLVVFDSEKKKSWKVLTRDASVMPGRWSVYNNGRKVTLPGGIFSLKLGVDGIAVDSSNEWVYFAPMNQEHVYRIQTRDLLNTIFSDNELSKKLEQYSLKPLSDGIEMDGLDNLYVTDVEHGAIVRLNREKKLETLVTSSKLRWPDGMSVAGGYLYITDSNLGEILFKGREKIMKAAPFYIYRVKLPED